MDAELGLGDDRLTTRPHRIVESFHEVSVHRLPIEPFRPVTGGDRFDGLETVMARAARSLAGRAVVTVNSTAVGGGVAEMLRRLLGYERASGLDARWYVLTADETFFRITKRLHHRLHGAPGDNDGLGRRERARYEEVMELGVAAVSAVVGPGDIVHLHDPQVLGLAPAMAATGARVIWQLHIGSDHRNDHTDEAWAFLAPYLGAVDEFVFSRAAYVPPSLDGGHVSIVAPSVDPFSVKNLPLDDPTAILHQMGVVADGEPARPPTFTRHDGSTGRVDRRASVVTLGPPPADAPIVVQVSRWDPLKGMVELIRAADQVELEGHGAHLVVVGPDVSKIDDDPEGSEVYATCCVHWEALPPRTRERVHIVCLPMDDPDENAAMVNTLQRHATVVVQNSRAEGFGLTVTEAMWKGRPVVASAVGGIVDQIVDGVSGVLADPVDPRSWVGAVNRLLADASRREALGAAGHERVRQRFLDDRQLTERANLYARLAAV
jgi:trehalose synthase